MKQKTNKWSLSCYLQIAHLNYMFSAAVSHFLSVSVRMQILSQKPASVIFVNKHQNCK